MKNNIIIGSFIQKQAVGRHTGIFAVAVFVETERDMDLFSDHMEKNNELRRTGAIKILRRNMTG